MSFEMAESGKSEEWEGLRLPKSEEWEALRLPKTRLRMHRAGRICDRMVVIVVTVGLGFMLLTVVAAVFLLGRTLLQNTTDDGAYHPTFNFNASDDQAARTILIVEKAKRLLASPISIGFLRHRQRAQGIATPTGTP